MQNAIAGYNYVHVQEISPDTTRLPLSDAPCMGLDTIVHGDSAVALWLRPGGGALLRVTYCDPGDTLGPGDTCFNSQKKLVFDGNRYHATYWRTADGPPHKDTIYYRRSLPVSSQTGAIRWDVWEYTIAPEDTNPTSVNDCFPSLTLRTTDKDTIVCNDEVLL